MLKWFRRAKKEEPLNEASSETFAPPSLSPAPGTYLDFDPAVIPDLDTIAENESMINSALAAAVNLPDEAPPVLLPTPEPLPLAPLAPPPPPAMPKGLFARLRDRLSKTKTSLVDKVRSALRLHGKLDEELLEEIEMILIQSDVGVSTTQKIVDRLRKELKRQGTLDSDAVMGLIKQSLEEILTTHNRHMNFDAAQPTIVLVVGVNGTGKTTTIGKLAKQLTDDGRRVMMVAGDTFRAAAIEQLTIWAERTGSCIVRQEQGADPAAVVFEALEGAKLDPPDVILIDTAGRLQTKTHLMEELRKIVRIIRKHYPAAPHETVLVLDATTGQNALSQIKLFHEVCELTGLVMSKLDGTAKGGILIACKDLYPLPVFKIGIGEGVEDLRDFDPHEFVEALFSTSGSGGETES